jgi:NTE family protein
VSDPRGSDHAMTPSPPARDGAAGGDLALVLSGGAARGAYQAGAIRRLARRFPDLRFSIVTGVSAGAINASFIAAHPGTLAEAMDELCGIWRRLQVEDIFRVDTPTLARHFTRWATRLAAGGSARAPAVRGLVDCAPLYGTIERSSATVDGEIIGIERNLERKRLKALALTALNYSTGQTVTWVQARGLPMWSQPQHRSLHARIAVDHVMASAALPIFFPAVRLGDSWYGDGGVRLSTPLVPAIRLGATRILAISPHHERSPAEAERVRSSGYPPPAEILGQLMEAIFLDILDEDARRLESLNRLIAKLPEEEREGLRHVAIRVLRPSQDLGELACAYEPRLPTGFRYLIRSLGSRESDTSDFLSMLMFQPDYLEKLIELGEEDAEARLGEIRELMGGPSLPNPSLPEGERG